MKQESNDIIPSPNDQQQDILRKIPATMPKKKTPRQSNPAITHQHTPTSTPAVTPKPTTLLPSHSTINHRPVTSCTHCRQHKIKCDAIQNFPSPCSRCLKYDLHCEIDPQFKPKKGSQIQFMRKELDELKVKVNYLLSYESAFTKSLMSSEFGRDILTKLGSDNNNNNIINNNNNTSEIVKAEQSSTSGNEISAPFRTPSVVIPAKSTTSLSFSASSSSSSPQQEQQQQQQQRQLSSQPESEDNTAVAKKFAVKTFLVHEPQSTQSTQTTADNTAAAVAIGTPINIGSVDNRTTKSDIEGGSITTTPSTTTTTGQPTQTISNTTTFNSSKQSDNVVVATTTIDPMAPPSYSNIDEFVIGDVRISLQKATELHRTFTRDYLPYFPIMFTNSVTELYSQSPLLFWTVMLTACLSDEEPTMYTKLSSLIKQLAIESCWIRTPRSTHISQALLLLCIWPLPGKKVLDDCSYRFVSLARSLSYQLGLHRGKFIMEFTTSQTSMPNAEKWRTRTWLGIFFAENCWASILGLPPTCTADYLVNLAISNNNNNNDDNDNNNGSGMDKQSQQTRQHLSSDDTTTANDDTDNDKSDKNNSNDNDTCSVPKNFHRLLCLSSFQLKLCTRLGSNASAPDGLMDTEQRGFYLRKFDNELDQLNAKLDFENCDDLVHIYYLYVRLMICCFAFLPETPLECQSMFVLKAYSAATKVVTLMSKVLTTHQLISLPIYVRQSATFSSFILFKLQLTDMLPGTYFNSVRQSIVTVHRLFRNQLTAWATVDNDISRTASTLERLNLVLVTHPEIFIEKPGIISRMRSHLTGSLFYDLVWCIHEAKRRETDPKYNEEVKRRNENGNQNENQSQTGKKPIKRKLYPLPLYSHITRDYFKMVSKTTPGGTTVTTLVPTEDALEQAKETAVQREETDTVDMRINGIPLSMLDETGSVKTDASPYSAVSSSSAGTNASTVKPAPITNTDVPYYPLSQSDFGALQTSSNFNINDFNNLGNIAFNYNNLMNGNTTANTTSQYNQSASKRQQQTPSLQKPTKRRRNNLHSLFNYTSNVLDPMDLQTSDFFSAIITNNTNANATAGRSSISNGHTNKSNNSHENYMDFNALFGMDLGSVPPPATSYGTGTVQTTVKGNTNPNSMTKSVTKKPVRGAGKMGINANRFNDFYQQQSAGWTEGNDDFLGLFGTDM